MASALWSVLVWPPLARRQPPCGSARGCLCARTMAALRGGGVRSVLCGSLGCGLRGESLTEKPEDIGEAGGPWVSPVASVQSMYPEAEGQSSASHVHANGGTLHGPEASRGKACSAARGMAEPDMEDSNNGHQGDLIWLQERVHREAPLGQ